MTNQHHMIGCTVLELNTGKMADVWSLQEDASQAVYQQLVPAMESLFDRLVAPDEVVRLDQVVVEAGAITPHELLSEWPHQVLTALERTLNDRISALKVQKQQSGMVTAGESDEGTLQERATADWQVLLYFLEYGRLPWWCSMENWQSWFPRWEAVLQQQTGWRQPLQQLLVNSSTARQRFVLQLPEPFRQQCLLQLQPGWIEWPSRLAQARRLLQGLNLDPGTCAQLETQAWQVLLAMIQPGQPLPVTEWAEGWLAQVVTVLRSQPPRSTSPLPPGASQQEPSLLQTSGQPDDLGTSTDGVRPVDQDAAEVWLAERLRDAIASLASQEQPLWLGAIPSELLTQPNLPVLPELPGSTPRQSPTSTDSSMDGEEDALRVQSAQPPSGATDPPMEADDQSVNSGDIVPELADEELTDTPLTLQMDDAVGQENEEEVDGNALETATPSSQRATQAAASDDESFADFVRAGVSGPPPELLALLAGEQSASEAMAQTARVTLSPDEERAGLYVTHAGLVLLHPFLANYFDAVGLVQDGVFQDATAQQQAVYLLHYLATGETMAPEPLLVLPKLLCDWSLNEPVAAGLSLPEAALVEGDQLLEAVIDHWQALKSTSPDGLRQGFLQRDGKLTHSESGWRLQVERQAIDVLLGRLPWGLSMVTLPWMDELLMVEWT